MDEGWEGSAPARRSPLLLGLALLVAVVLSGFLVRPSAPQEAEQPEGDLEVRPGEAVPPPTPPAPQRAVVHALNTASLEHRVQPLEVDLAGWGRLRTATTERGRQLLLLALESAGGEVAELHVADAATLQPVAHLGQHPGPLSHVGFTGDGRAVVWLRASVDPAEPSTVHRLPVDGGPPATVELPTGFRVRELRGLRDGRVAVAGTAAPATPGTPLTVLVHHVEDGPVAELELDVGEHVRDTDGSPLEGMQAALAWDTLRHVLHVVHARDDRMTSVRLTDGAVQTSPEAGGVRAIARRQALLDVDGDAVVATGTVTRAIDLAEPSRGIVSPLEPLRFITDRATLSFQAATPAELHARGPAEAGEVVAAAAGTQVLAARTRLADGRVGVALRALDADLAPAGEGVELAGDVVASRLDAGGTRLRIATATQDATEVRILDPLDGRVVAERAFAPGAEVHPGAAVVVERR